MYCVVQDVKNVLRHMIQYGSNPAMGQVSDNDIQAAIVSASGRVDARITHMYYTPIRPSVSRDAASYGNSIYDANIVRATAALAGSLLLNTLFAEADPGLSQRAVDLNNEFDGIMQNYESGRTIILGQRRKARSHAVTPSMQQSPDMTTNVVK